MIRPLIGATTRGMKWHVDFTVGNSQLISFDQSNNSVVIDLKISLTIMKNHPIMPNLPFPSKLHWFSYSVPFAKAASKEIVASIRSWSFFLLRLFGASINLLYDLAWITVLWLGWCHYFLIEYWDKVQDRECRTVNHSLDTLTHCLNAATLSLFWRYCFGRCSSELAEVFLLPYFNGRYTCYSNRLHDFSVTIPGYYKDVYVSSIFPRTARLWNSLREECFPLTYYRNGFKGARPKFPYFAVWLLCVWKYILSNLKSSRQIILFWGQ